MIISKGQGIVLGSVMLGGVITYFSLNSMIKTKALNRILEAIEKETSTELESALDTSYWRKVPISAKLLKAGDVNAIVSEMYAAWGKSSWTQPDYSKMYIAFKKCANKAQISQVAYSFQNKYKKDLFEMLRSKKKSDQAVFQFDLLHIFGLESEDFETRISEYIETLPNY